MESNSFLAIDQETFSHTRFFERWLQEKLDKVRVKMAEFI
jgi:hypothetical protein